MIKISRKLDYAVLAVSHFCLNRGQVVSARTIAETYRIPLAILANILKVLAKSGVIDSVRGVGGGYVLATNPEDLTLGELARIVEGPFRRLSGEWTFKGLGGSGCRVSLDLRFEFANRVTDLVLGPFFEEICNSLVDAFTRRARELYESPGDAGR